MPKKGKKKSSKGASDTPKVEGEEEEKEVSTSSITWINQLDDCQALPVFRMDWTQSMAVIMINLLR